MSENEEYKKRIRECAIRKFNQCWGAWPFGQGLDFDKCNEPKMFNMWKFQCGWDDEEDKDEKHVVLGLTWFGWN
jgi:hypothetical protein